MTKYAFVIDTLVNGVFEATPEYAAEKGWIKCPPEVSPGWLYDGATFTPPDPEPISKEQVNAERDRRIAAGFAWGGYTFQSDKDSRENITGASTSAVSYIVGGGSPDEVYWQSPDVPFVWIAMDNTEVQMTPAQVIDFGNTAMAHKKAHIFAARTLKDMATIPQDFNADKYWP